MKENTLNQIPFDKSSNYPFQSVNQIKQSMKITFDEPQVDFILPVSETTFKNFTKIRVQIWIRDHYGGVCFIVTVSAEQLRIEVLITIKVVI